MFLVYFWLLPNSYIFNEPRHIYSAVATRYVSDSNEWSRSKLRLKRPHAYACAYIMRQQTSGITNSTIRGHFLSESSILSIFHNLPTSHSSRNVFYSVSIVTPCSCLLYKHVFYSYQFHFYIYTIPMPMFSDP